METHEPNVYPTILEGVSRGFWSPFLDLVLEVPFFSTCKRALLAKVPFFRCQKMAIRAPKSKNGLQKPREHYCGVLATHHFALGMC